MSKRPPQRHVARNPPAPAVDSRLSTVDLDAPSGSQSDAPPPAAARDVRPAPVATSREELVDLLGDLRQQGSLDVADEAALLRKYDGLLVELRAEKARLETEFRERMSRDGPEETNAWLAGAAEALGRRQGEQMRQLMTTIPALSAHFGHGDRA